MADVFGTVKLMWLGEPAVATLDTEGKWQAEQADLARMLNESYGPDQYGPSDGFPLHAALRAVERASDGTITHEPPLSNGEPGAVF